MRKLFPLIFIFFVLSLFSLQFLFLLPFLFVPLFFIKRKDFSLFFIIFILIGIIRSGFLSFPFTENPKTNILNGKVISFENKSSFDIKTEYGRVTVFKSKNYNIKPYDEVEVRGEFINDFGGNLGEETYILYSISKGSILKFYARDLKVIRKDTGFLSILRDKLYRNFDLLPKEYSFVRGIFMGGGSVDRDVKEKFKYAGVMHLLAVSGLHLSIISMFLSFILPPLFVVFALFVYLLLILFPVSLVRAFIMLSVYFIGKNFFKDVDTVNSLLFGATIILFINPLSIISPSFLLTFLSTFSIISVMSGLDNTFKKILLISPASLFGIFPVLAYYFPIFSPISLVSNMVISPIFPLFLPVIFVFSILSLIDKNFIYLLEFPAKGFLSLINIFSNTFLSYVGVKKPHFGFLFFYFILFGIVVLKRNWGIKVKWEKGVIILLIVAIFISFVYPYYKENGILKVMFFDVGEGDSIFIKTPKGKTLLIDGGGTLDPDRVSPGEIVLNSLKRIGVNKLNVMLFTHEDTDHIEGLFHVIEKEGVNLLCGPQVNLGKMGKRLISIAEDKGIEFRAVKQGDVFKIDDDVKIYVLNPVEGGKLYDRANDNNNSVFLVLKYKGFSVVLSGDVEKEGLYEITDNYPELLSNATVYKVAHHGSKYSFSEEFFDTLSPKVSVISVGHNRFGHPSSVIIDYLTSVGSKIYRTDIDGCIEMVTDGERLWIKEYDFAFILDWLKRLNQQSINFNHSLLTKAKD